MQIKAGEMSAVILSLFRVAPKERSPATHRTEAFGAAGRRQAGAHQGDRRSGGAGADPLW